MSLEQDYITRQVNLLMRAVLKAMALRKEEDDVEALDEAGEVLHTATGMDAATLLKMDPASLVMMLEVGQVSDRSAVWIAASLELQAQMHQRSGNDQLALLRNEQARAVRTAFLVDASLDELLAEADEEVSKQESDAKEY